MRLPRILDALPSPSGAFALARLLSSYAGPLFRVRRSSDSTETDIYPVSDGRFDVAALLAFCGAGNGLMVRVYDQTGSGNHFEQTTATAQPRIVNAGALELTAAGRPSMFFDGVNHFMTSPDASKFVNPTAFAQYMRAEVLAASAANANFYDVGGIQGANLGHFGLAVQVGGVIGGVIGGAAANTPRDARTTGARGLHLRYTGGATVGLSVDNGADATTACGTMASIPGVAVRWGIGFNGFLSGRSDLLVFWASDVKNISVKQIRDSGMSYGIAL